MASAGLGPQRAFAGRSGWWWLALGALLVGAGLRLWQWALGTTFFMDELAVLHNVATRSASQLVRQPLAEAQVAPPLFLLLEKACLTWLGHSEQALRLPALLASLAALPLLWAVARRVLDERVVPLVLLTVAVGFTFVFYSNQAKQYAGDVAAALLVLWLALRLRDAPGPPPRFRALAAAIGLVLPFYSQASLLVLSGCGGALVLLAALDAGRPRLHATGAVVAAWALGSGASLWLAQSLLRPIDRAFMHFFWREGFLPLTSRLPVVLAGELTERWANGLGWPHPAILWVVGGAVGAGLLWWQRREAALLLLAPWLLAAVASALRQFPLRMRLMDFLVPTLVIFLFAALQEVVRGAWRRGRPLGVAALVLCAAPIGYSTTRHNLPPFSVEDVEPLFAQLARVRRPTDAVYVYYGAGQALRWYGPRYGLGPGRAVLGHCYRHLPGAERHYLAEADAFRGRRVWLVMVHFDPYESQVLNAYLGSIGRRGPSLRVAQRMPDESVGYPVVYAQRYDLTDAKRAARFAASTFPLPPAPLRPANEICWSCYGPQVIGGGQ
ncbi:glycosyltransferase family 39 protein [Hymenobacter sp. PAMC 26628]|uniref:glycosyltransferase family 39 protein n=1 Tax=Hymenobacter sp. PAMC 26628 TaxID=1484118 RepID=UPI0009E9D591|nr:glycosyltransferase family 39 protein [Hymenobacter sp. PAMC 26628]